MANVDANLNAISNAEQRLAAICSVDYPTQHSRNQGYSNQDILEVSRLLDATKHAAWAAYPRLYIVLRCTGLLRLRNMFLSIRHTDAHFPYSAFNLPKGMKVEERSSFLQAQTCILTGASQISRWELGEHVRFASSEQVPLESKAVLGTGGSGQVEVVTLRTQARTADAALNKQLVRKLIRRRVFGRLQQGLEVFKNELSVLKRVQHRHIVEIIGSYTDPSFAALIMSPVADWDLTDFIRIAAVDNQKLSSMRTFFGCLAAALAYLHKERIRHKDIKPSNILVHGTNVLITDFGISRDCNDTRSTTEGRTAMTIKYAAPEVADYGPRNFSSDIWSLGCVYLEMMTVLKRTSLDQLSSFMLKNGTGMSPYHANSDSVHLWISKIRGIYVRESDDEILDWIQAMLMQDRDLRPSAETLAVEIANSSSNSGRVGEFCGICCRGGDEQYIDVEMEDEILVPESSLFAPEDSDANIVQSTEDLSEPSIAREVRDTNSLESPRNIRVTITSPAARENKQGTSNPMTTDSDISQPLTRGGRDLTLSRFFILRSKSAIDIETSSAFQVWTCGRSTNLRLNKAIKETKADIYLIFSVVGSRKFCGVARMAGFVDFTTTLPHWQSDGWEGNFDLEWKSHVEVDYDDVEHLRIKEGGKGNYISRVMSGMEICYSSGIDMMIRFQVQGFFANSFLQDS